MLLNCNRTQNFGKSQITGIFLFSVSYQKCFIYSVTDILACMFTCDDRTINTLTITPKFSCGEKLLFPNIRAIGNHLKIMLIAK